MVSVACGGMVGSVVNSEAGGWFFVVLCSWRWGVWWSV